MAVGSEVRDIEIGDVVGLKWLNGACGSCEMCLLGHESNCGSALFSGYTVDGSFQQYAIGKANHVAKLPRDCDQAAAAPISTLKSFLGGPMDKADNHSVCRNHRLQSSQGQRVSSVSATKFTSFGNNLG